MLIPIAAQRPIMSNVVLMVEVMALRAYANFLIARVPKVATAFSGSPLDAVSICLVLLIVEGIFTSLQYFAVVELIQVV